MRADRKISPHFCFVGLDWIIWPARRRAHNESHIDISIGVRAYIGRGEQDAKVLAAGDQQILNLLSPQPAPSGSLEAMIVGCVGEASFHQVTTTAAIALGRTTVRLSLRFLD